MPSATPFKGQVRDLAGLARRSLAAQRVRTLLSALSVALGVGVIVANGVVITGIEDAWAGNTNIMSGFLDTMFGVLFTGMGVIFSAAAGFLIFNAFAMSVTQRQQEIGAMRALGMTRRQVTRQILVEALTTGGLGTAAGLALGPLIGIGMLALFQQTGLEIGTGHLRLSDVVIGVIAGLVVSTLASLIPARRAARVSPLEALRRPATQSGDRIRTARVVAGILLAAGLTGYVIIAPPGEWTGKNPPWEWIMTFVLWAAWFTASGLLAPALIGGIMQLLRGPIIRVWKAHGRLAADNLTRSRGRVTTTVVTFAIAMASAVGVAGIVTFNNSLVQINADQAASQVSWTVLSFDSSTGLAQLNSMGSTTFFLKQEVIDDVLTSTEDLALVTDSYTVLVPELSSPIPGFPSYIVDPRQLDYPGGYRFSEGSWETALPIMEAGCGVLVTSNVAGKFEAGLGDTIAIEGIDGPVECTIAGIGGGGFVAWTFIGIGAKDSFVPAGRLPDTLNVRPLPGVEGDRIEAALQAVASRHPADAFIVGADDQIEGILETSDQLMGIFSMFVLLAQVVAALGIINTTMISVTERRHELGLLRAVGATRRQVTAVVTGEAALMGLIGSLLGAALGAGMGMLYALAQGGLVFGIADLDIWQAALNSVPPALAYGWIGIAAAPLLAAGAAYPIVRSILRGSAIDTMDARRTSQREPRREARGMLQRLGFLALRNLTEHPTRASLSILAVALGVATVIASSMTSQSIINSIAGSDALTYMQGIIDQLGGTMQMVGVGIGLVAGFMVFNAFLMSITQRRRQIGALRSLGMTRRQVMRLVLGEALITAVAGTLAGVIAGPLMGYGTILLVKTVLAGIFAFEQSSPTPSSFAVAIAVGLGITLLSVLIPARQAARISPLVALRGEMITGRVKPQRQGLALWAGVAILAGLGLFVVIALPGEWVKAPQDILLTGLCVLALGVGVALTLPALIGGVGGLARSVLSRVWGATGRLAADNLGRERGRVMRTLSALAISLTMVVGLTGFLSFATDLLMPTLERVANTGAWMVVPFDFAEGMSAYAGLDDIETPREAIDDIQQTVGDRGVVMDTHFAIVPELSFFGTSYFTMVLDPRAIQQSGSSMFSFIEGDWETALPLMENGCGALVAPAVASRNGAGVGDTITVTGADGPVECAIAGIGSPMVNASIVGLAAGDSFGVGTPIGASIWTFSGLDREAVQADVEAALAPYPALHLNEVRSLYELEMGLLDAIPLMFNALLLLAVLAAALGVVNTTLISVTERQRELGLLRAVGATRRQVTQVVVGEAALIGLVGGLLGLATGLGIVVVIALVYGGNSWGVPDLDLWGEAGRSAQAALITGLVGLVASPIVSSAAAYFPARSILRGTPIETIEPERQTARGPRRAVAGLLRRGSIQMRFAASTAVLMLVVMVGLMAVVTSHARLRIEQQMHDTLRQLASFNAGVLELALPEDAQNLDFEALTSDGSFGFNADAMLQLESVMNGMASNGLVDFTIADKDQVILMSLDQRRIGQPAPEQESPGAVAAASEREDGEWLMRAYAPVRNEDGQVVGSVRITVDAAEAQGFLRTLRSRLWLAGGLLAALGAVIAWRLGAPLSQSARQLAHHAGGVTRGEYALFQPPARRGLSRWLSLRARLTIAMVVILVAVVGLLQAVTIPIERRHLEGTLKDGMVAAVAWIGEVASDSFVATEEAGLPLDDEAFSLDEALEMTETLDIARLQELGDQMRSEDVAYFALVNNRGEIVISDQFGLIGESAPVYDDTRIEDSTWRGSPIWVATTPLRRGRDGDQIGALRMAVRPARIEEFLQEARNLFALAGIIAVLAGILLAQALGTVVAVPIERLAAGARRIGRGDLAVRFEIDTRDELGQLASAYNQMVAGLQEREWLRDMFGRFVSQEVAEAIRSGQVRLEGENRVVSVLFTDIRDFTALSERYQPGEIVGLLNQFLPVVVSSAQAHSGTVNKFGGDSTLIIYGAPRALQESSYHAVLTALSICHGLGQLNRHLEDQGWPPIQIGVGINTGVVLAGAVGPAERQEYTVIGDTVNLASRIQALNKQYPEHDILISHHTYEALGSHRAEFELVDVGEMPIRGKTEPVRVWSVVASRLTP